MMRFTPRKDKFAEIDNAFSVLKETPDNKSACKIIQDALHTCFNCNFTVTVVKDVTNGPLFVMSVYPDKSTVDKIIECVMNDGTDNDIETLWKKVENWTIEIDERILIMPELNCSNKELTAVLLHEVGHIAATNSIPQRVSTVLRYELIKSSMSQKLLLRDKLFRGILSLPILNACVCNQGGFSSIDAEVKADKFVKSMGYEKELASILNKFIHSNRYPKKDVLNKNMKTMASFSKETMDEFYKRKTKLLKHQFERLANECASPYLKESVIGVMNNLFENDVTEESSMVNDKKMNFMMEHADKVVDEGYVTEFFVFGGKKLKKLDWNEIDYALVKSQDIKSNSDKMMILTYIQSKIDLIDYYLSIMNNPKVAKKYVIPHSQNELWTMKKRLLDIRQKTINYQIPQYQPGMMIAWPEGYEG